MLDASLTLPICDRDFRLRISRPASIGSRLPYDWYYVKSYLEIRTIVAYHGANNPIIDSNTGSWDQKREAVSEFSCKLFTASHQSLIVLDVRYQGRDWIRLE